MSRRERDARETTDAVARRSYGKLIAFLAARTRDRAAAEDALSEAFSSALAVWPSRGCPSNPEAWLLTVARRKIIDFARRDRSAEIAAEQLRLSADRQEAEMAAVEQALRESEPLRGRLRQVMQERDRGDHSLGAVWRRERLSCPTREQLGSYLLQVLDDGQQEYIEFHLNTVGCPFCVANLQDLQTLQKEPAPQARARRRRYFESSAGFLHVAREGK